MSEPALVLSARPRGALVLVGQLAARGPVQLVVCSTSDDGGTSTTYGSVAPGDVVVRHKTTRGTRIERWSLFGDVDTARTSLRLVDEEPE